MKVILEKEPVNCSFLSLFLLFTLHDLLQKKSLMRTWERWVETGRREENCISRRKELEWEKELWVLRERERDKIGRKTGQKDTNGKEEEQQSNESVKVVSREWKEKKDGQRRGKNLTDKEKEGKKERKKERDDSCEGSKSIVSFFSLFPFFSLPLVKGNQRQWWWNWIDRRMREKKAKREEERTRWGRKEKRRNDVASATTTKSSQQRNGRQVMRTNWAKE